MVAIVAASIFCGSAAATDRIFWSGVGSVIYVANLDGSGAPATLNTAGATVDDATGMAIDPKRRWLVFANQANNTFAYARLDGGGGGSLGDGDPSGASLLSNPDGISIDTVSDRVFFANNNTSSLVFAPFDPSVAGGTFTSGGTKSGIYGLTLDPATRMLWWTAGSKIAYAQIPGGVGGDLTVNGATVSSARGIALDSATGTLWWANGTASNKISHAKLDGSAGADLAVGSATVDDPRGVAIDVVARRIYWANNNGGTISWAKLDGSGGGDLFPSTTLRRFVLIQLVPRGTGAPVVSGGSDPGAVLSCSDGSWLPDSPEAFMYAAPTSVAYQWTLSGNDIAGATGATFTASQPGDYRCRVTASNEAGSTSQTSDAHTINAPVTGPLSGGGNQTPTPPALQLTKPALTALTETNKVFGAGPLSTPLTGKTAARRKKGTVFSFRLDKVATVKVVIRRKRSARRFVQVTTLKRSGHGGLNKIAFSGRIRKRALKPGSYTATFTASNSAGTSAARTVTFKIVRR